MSMQCGAQATRESYQFLSFSFIIWRQKSREWNGSGAINNEWRRKKQRVNGQRTGALRSHAAHCLLSSHGPIRLWHCGRESERMTVTGSPDSWPGTLTKRRKRLNPGQWMESQYAAAQTISGICGPNKFLSLYLLWESVH